MLPSVEGAGLVAVASSFLSLFLVGQLGCLMLWTAVASALLVVATLLARKLSRPLRKLASWAASLALEYYLILFSPEWRRAVVEMFRGPEGMMR